MYEINTATGYSSDFLSNRELNVDLIYCRETRQISFEIEDSFKWKNRKNKVAITRWLLRAWEQFLLMSPKEFIICFPEQHDGKGEYRIEAYKKLGFKLVNRNCMVWGDVDRYFDYMKKFE